MAVKTVFKCPKCGAESKAGEWNSSTLEYCTKEKRSFMYKIQQSPPTLSYVCPECGEVSIKTKIEGV